MTEARLDLAELDRISGDPDAARARLEAAREVDPTRFDLPLRLGHLALGEEPVPGDPAPPGANLVEALRHYNEAHALAPGRFEYDVALSRLARRRGDLSGAAEAVHRALDEVAPEAAAALGAAVPGGGSPRPTWASWCAARPRP